MPKPASDPTATGVTLRADVRTSTEGPVTYWFEYGTTTAYGTATPQRTVASEDAGLVAEPVTGLSPDTSYHFRACASDEQEVPPRVNCSRDARFGTVGDSVSGSGSIHFPTGTGPGILVAELWFQDIRSGPAGENPAGVLRMSPGGEILDYEVTCLRVEGTRFTIGSRRGSEEPTFAFFDVTDSEYGRADRQPVDGRDPSSCPDPAEGLPGQYNFVHDDVVLRDAP
jgi:hypothetical protein